MISVSGVHKSFGAHEVLRGVSLEVAAGEVVVVLGPSGSGKSTLLRTINHLEKVDRGFIGIDGDLVGYRRRGGKLHELKERDVLKQRRHIGFVFQDFNLFPHLTALENVAEAAELAEARRTWNGLAWETRPTRIRGSSPAASSNASRSREPSPRDRKSCCSTSPPRHWTRSWSVRCWTCCATSPVPAPRWSWSRTRSASPARWPTASCSSTKA